MEHPPSPEAPPSPPAGQRERMGYRPPPPYAYPHYVPYGSPPQGQFGPPPGYTARPPPAGYPGPPHHPSPYGFAYPSGPRGYHPSYDAAYPPIRQPGPYRGPPRNSHSLSTPQGPAPQKRIGLSLSPRSSPGRSSRETSGALAHHATEQVEVERLRAAAAAELTHEEVKPIRSDFHFFVKENAAKLRFAAEEELKKSSRGEDGKLDEILVNSYLNQKLKEAWENLSTSERDAFMVKEEDDRRRFMEEDEIASRHCATLTARGKSPRIPEKLGKSEERQECEAGPALTPDRDSSPSARLADNSKSIRSRSAEMDCLEASKRSEEAGMPVESRTKRSQTSSKEETSTYESPSKKSR